MITCTVNSARQLVAEGCHPESQLEWWFVQGEYRGRKCGQRHFLASFFSQGLSAAPDADRGSMLLLALLPADASATSVRSQVDPPLLSFYLGLADKMAATGINRKYVQIIHDELQRYGTPRPIAVAKGKVQRRDSPLDVAWGDFSLKQERGGFLLSFLDEENVIPVRLYLTARHARFCLDNIRLPHGNTMSYASRPLLNLRGEAAGETVRGTAWLDHQWGNMGWLVGGTNEDRILGWSWLGINLENGDDLLIMLHRDMKTRRVILRYAVHLQAGNKAKVLRRFTAVPLRWWSSGRTQIRYPVSWHLHLPEIGADLVFSPLTADQEIPLLGALRAVWEGAGTISGRMAGRSVSGRGRLELYGEGFLFEPQRLWHEMAGRIDRQIEQFLPRVIGRKEVRRFLGAAEKPATINPYSEVIAKPFWDLMDRRGKRWRAMFGLFLLEALGVASGPYELLAGVLSELPHCGSLIIDDIEDGSFLRRGSQSIHLCYGLDVAINCANTLYFLPYLLVENHQLLSADQRFRMFRVMNRNFVRVHFGQGQDIFWSSRLTLRRLAEWNMSPLGRNILSSYAHKTGAPLMGLAEIDGIIAGSDEKTIRSCVAFARVFGIAFQIVDDILNFADARLLKKKCGEDLATGKVTYVIFRALQLLYGAERRRLAAILCSDKLRRDEKALREGIRLIHKSGSLSACADEAKRMVEREWHNFSRVVPPTPGKTMLRLLCTGLMNLSHSRSGGRHFSCRRRA